MANPIIKIKRGATAPVATLNAGEFAIDQVAKNLYLGVEVGGVVTNEIVGGNGTFATHTDVATAVSAGTGSLGTMSTQDADSVAITGGSLNNSVNALGITGADISGGTLDGTINAQTAVIDLATVTQAIIENSTIRNNCSVDGTIIGANTPSTGAFTTLTASSAPSASNDVVRKTDLDTAIGALGSVFHFVGDVSSAATPLALSTLSDTTTGAYYKVDVAGAYTDGATTFNAKVGDAFVKTTTGWQKLDNVDVVVSGTTDEITVTGDENSGYVVSLTTGTPNSWKDGVDGDLTSIDGRATALESKTQNFGTITAGSTEINGGIWGDGALSFDGNIESGGNIDAYQGNISAFGTVSGGSLTVTGNSTLTGNLSVTGNITDAVIDGGVY